MANLTLRDIAQALNLSVSTVSKALNDSYEIGEETKKRVLAYARANHYLPNYMAKSLKEGKSGSIGVVVCSIDNTFVSRMLDGIDTISRQAGYDIIIMQSKESFDQELSCLKQLEARGVEGILISPSEETADFGHLLALKEAGLPVVLFDRINEHFDTYQVGIDNHRGAYLATQHLIERGYKRIAMLNIRTNNYIASQRFKGFVDALEHHQVGYEQEYVRRCSYTSRSGLISEVTDALQSLLQLPQPPDALFTATDQLTIQSLNILHRLGHRIPKDLALIGFSNTDLADVITPPLSTVYQPAYEIGKLATEKLIGLITGNDKPTTYETIKLPIRLNIRQSSLSSLPEEQVKN